MPWSNIVKFHNEIAVRSEESFFSFPLSESNGERYSFIKEGVIDHMLVDDKMHINGLCNPQIFTNLDQRPTVLYIGGVFWYTNKRSGNDNGASQISEGYF